MFKRFLLGTAGVLVAASMASTAANALLIDSFTDYLENDLDNDGIGGVTDVDADGFDDFNGEPMGDGEVRDNTGNGVSVFNRSVQVNGTIIGGDRELVLNKITGPATPSISIGAGVIDPGWFTHSNPATISGTSLLRWDGAAGGNDLDMGLTDGAGGIDVTEGGTNNGVGLKVISADLANGSTLELRLYTSLTQFSAFLLQIPLVTQGPPANNSPFSALFTFADILGQGTQGGGGDADLTDIRAIELLATGESNFDLAVDFFETTDVRDVPEPASMALIGAGLVGLGGMAHRRKAAER